MQPRNVVTLAGLLCCMCIVGLLGCASLARPIPQPKPTQVYASFTKTWTAAVDYFARSGISLDTTDRSSGVIRADVTTMPRNNTHFVSCGSSMVESYWHKHGGWYLYTESQGPPLGAPFIAIVHGDSARATLKVRSEWIDAAGKEVKCAEASTWWDRATEEAIRTLAERP
jgi:hypothetical protein